MRKFAPIVIPAILLLSVALVLTVFLIKSTASGFTSQPHSQPSRTVN